MHGQLSVVQCYIVNTQVHFMILLFNYVVCPLRKKKTMPLSFRQIRRFHFPDLSQAKTCSKKENLNLGHFLDLLLKFRKFQA